MKPAPCPGCEGERRQTFVVEGLDCAAEVAVIEEQLGRIDGVCSVRASAVTGEATIVHTLGPGQVERAFAQAGFRAHQAAPAGLAPASARATVVATALAAAGCVAGFVSPAWSIALYLPAIVVGGTAVARRGWQRARQGALDMNAVSGVDQSPLTGESKRVTKQPGDEVLAGSINGGGVLDVRVTRAAGETTLARILRRTLEAQASRAPSQSFVDRFARIYTPLVMALALGVACLPPLLAGGDLAAWTYRGLVLLVIACPCALVIATPVAVVSGLTAASRRGVLVKGGVHLEDLGRIRAVVFDKTGTLSTGRPEVMDVLPAGGSPREVLALAAVLEARSAHPIGEAVVERARREGITPAPATRVGEIPGRGVHGLVEGRLVLVGSHRLFDERGLCDHRLDAELRRLESEGKSAVLVGSDEGVLGALAVTDGLRPEAARAVDELRALGLELAVLSGDNHRTVGALAARLGIEEAHAELLPEGKVERLGRLQSRWGPTAMIGDGINDAPALAAATVGIAMGERGTDVALETADVALMAEDLRLVPFALRLGAATRRTIRVNVGLSLAVKAIVLGLGVAGYGSLWAAVGADMGASLLVIANGLRLLRPREAAGA